MAPPGRETGLYVTNFARLPLERALAEVARRQHGVIALAQFRALGLSDSAVRRRAAAGRLHRVHRGVYAVQPQVLSAAGRYMAAVLACGEDAALSHRSAADHQGLRRCERTSVEVISPSRTGRAKRGIHVHRAGSLRPDDVVLVDGIPCTSIARTLLDLATCVPPRSLERAVDRAERLRVFDLVAIEDVLNHAARHPGAARLRKVLGVYAPDSAFLRSEFERRLFAICDGRGLPQPSVNTFIPLARDGFEVDFAWHGQRVVVETDGWRYHRTRKAFEDDRRRDQQLATAGWLTLRFTWRQITHEPEDVARTIVSTLERRGATPARGSPGSSPRGPPAP